MRRRQTCSPHFSVMSFWLTLEAPACSRICNGQSTKEPQGSTGTDQHEVGYSIKITYFHPISTDFHKRRDLFWDRWSYLHNLLRLNGLQNGPRVSWSAFEILFGIPLDVAQIHFRVFFGAGIGRPSLGFCRRNRSRQQLAVSFESFGALSNAMLPPFCGKLP
jgi:hypothetical protein